MKKERKKDKELLRIEPMCVFNLGHRENAERILIALCSAGYFANIINSSGSFLVYVYKRT